MVMSKLEGIELNRTQMESRLGFGKKSLIGFGPLLVIQACRAHGFIINNVLS